MSDSKLSRRNAVLHAVTGLGIGALIVHSSKAQAQTTSDLDVLKALIGAERNAIATYTAGAGVIDAATNADPLYAFRGIVKAIALHYASQHADHERVLVTYFKNQGGDEATLAAGTFTPPMGFVPTIKNVVDLATNAEKSAAIAYVEVQKSLTNVDNAELAAAIGADETSHFVVLQLIARGFLTPTQALANVPASALGDAAKTFAPRSFVVTIGADKGLNDSALPFYSYT